MDMRKPNTPKKPKPARALAALSKNLFQKKITEYYKAHGRHTLPWRKTHSPYRILISEIMLQQTQVSRVIPKYNAFLKKFPDFTALANASTSELLGAWQGLGYNRRALYLRSTAQKIVSDFGNKLPKDQLKLITFKGIGTNTAGAICAYAFNMPAVFIETNIRRVYLDAFFKDASNVSDSEIVQLISETMNAKNPREWYWAIVDYGAYLGTKAGNRIIENPNRKSKQYARQSVFKGSNRQLRGEIVRLLLNRSTYSFTALANSVKDWPDIQITAVIKSLSAEGFVVEKNGKIFLKN